MLLTDHLADYATRRAISDKCFTNYRKHLRDLATFHGRPLRTSDLSPPLIDRWLTAKLRDGRSPYYVVALRSTVRTIWQDAYILGKCPTPPLLMPVRRPDLIVSVWSADDVTALIAAARRLPGMFENLGVLCSSYLATAIAATWYAGVRRGDLHRIRWDQLRRDGTITLIQHKTGRRHVARIPASVLREASQWSRAPGPVWRRPGGDELISRRFRRVVALARKERPGMIDGWWRDIRRSAENSAERRHPGQGHLLAGHERRTFEKYYRATDESPPVQPEPLP